MLFGETESVSNPRFMSLGMAALCEASSPQILTGFVAWLTMLSSAEKTTGESSSALSRGWVRSMAKGIV